VSRRLFQVLFNEPIYHLSSQLRVFIHAPSDAQNFSFLLHLSLYSKVREMSHVVADLQRLLGAASLTVRMFDAVPLLPNNYELHFVF
jgi:hypothetical protein